MLVVLESGETAKDNKESGEQTDAPEEGRSAQCMATEI